ncbi:HIRAN domain-containing protein [Streptococcus gallinaceus]|uniref:HIRAN domain-containing protein n=1 Tax=Streptococcus gallinaceus TaxID=165758 RepID=A0ABV2JKK4_9STRE
MTHVLKGFEPRRHYLDFHLAAFAYYDGLEVIDQLKLGAPVQLMTEPENIHDPHAVVIFFENTKIGYVPADYNQELSKFLYFGYGDIFEARIQMVNHETHPERQFRVVVKLKDNR